MGRVWLLMLLGVLVCGEGVVGGVALSFLSPQDLEGMKVVFQTSIKDPADLAAAHYGVNGLQLLGATVEGSQKLCQYAQSQLDKKSLESIYHASGLSSRLSGCKLDVSGVQKFLEEKIAGSKSLDLLYITNAAKNLGIKLDVAKVSAALKEAIKADDAAASLGYAFHAAVTLEGPGSMDPFFDRVEDLVAQADDIDGKYLQFEGGLSVTAIAISGVYNLADKMNKTPSIKADEAVKFASFLLSRKGVQLIRPAFHMLNALKILTKNKFHVPVSMSLSSNVAVSSSDPMVRIKACNVMGETVGPLSVTIDSATHVPTSGVVLSKQPMKAISGDSTGYQFSFLDTKRAKGFYKLSISAGSQQDKRLIGTQGAEVNVKVMTEMGVDGLEISVVDREQTSTGKVHKVQHPNAVSGILEADHHQKILMKFALKEKATNEAMKVHQAFVVFTNQETKQEIIFVAEPDSKNMYNFDTDLQKSSKEFDYTSGKYQMKLVVGDAVVNNPLSWNVANFKLSFPQPDKTKSADTVSYEKRPELVHTFRQPEKRPPAVVSTTFTALVVVPFIILLILWLRIGVNISNFPLSLSSIGFHLGLGGILGLYFWFWVEINMFQTLKYLTLLSIFTLITGNRMLRSIAESKKAKVE